MWPHDIQLFTGIRGKGAFLNGTPIKGKSKAPSLQALLILYHQFSLWISEHCKLCFKIVQYRQKQSLWSPSLQQRYVIHS